MDIEKTLLLLMYILVSVLLIWAAVSDWKTRLIPRISGLGLLTIGFVYLLYGHNYAVAGYYLIMIIYSGLKHNGTFVQLFVILLSILVLLDPTKNNDYIFGMLFTIFMYKYGVFGGGDSKIALALLAIGQDWTMLYYIFLPNIIIAFILIIKNQGVSGLSKRIIRVFNNFRTKNKPSEGDTEAIWFPWAVIAAPAALVYFWIYPGTVY